MSDSKYHQALSANRKLVAEIERLKAENERLRKAGDELLKSFKQTESFMRTVYAINAWNAAKEGRDAK